MSKNPRLFYSHTSFTNRFVSAFTATYRKVGRNEAAIKFPEFIRPGTFTLSRTPAVHLHADSQKTTAKVVHYQKRKKWYDLLSKTENNETMQSRKLTITPHNFNRKLVARGEARSFRIENGNFKYRVAIPEEYFVAKGFQKGSLDFLLLLKSLPTHNRDAAHQARVLC